MLRSLRAEFARLHRGDLEVEGLLPASRITAASDAAGYQDHGGMYTAVVTMQMFLAQLLRPDRSCQRAVCGLAAHRAAQQAKACSVATGGYCLARQRLPEEMFWKLMRESGREGEQAAPAEWLWCRRRVRVVDGSTLQIADTPANRSEYPLQAGLQPGCHFPVVRILVVFSLAVGVVIDAALRAYQGKGTGETGMLRDLAKLFTPGDVLLGDRYFAGYWDLAWWLVRGVDVVTRLPVSRRSDFRRGQRLGKKDHLIVWRRTAWPEWMTRDEAQALPRELTLRELHVQVDAPGFRTRCLVVVTTLLDAQAYPATKLRELYRRRWQAELNLRSLKTQLKMEQLQTKKPATVRKEFTTYLLAYNCVRRVMLEAARTSAKEPRQISFQGTLQSLLEFLARFHRTPSVTQWVDQLLAIIAQLKVGHRPNRVEPYATKRRPKDYPPLQETRDDYKTRICSYT